MQQLSFENDQVYAKNMSKLKDVSMKEARDIIDRPIEENYQHKTIRLEHDMRDSVLISYAFEDLKINPQKYSHLFNQKHAS
jgi:hypothetical protein